MINSLPIRINYKKMDLFKSINHIHFDINADIQLLEWPIISNDFNTHQYKILYVETISDELLFFCNLSNEIWVKNIDDKCILKKFGISKPILILTEDKSLLPLTMKDRFAYLQDQINKKNIKY